MINGRRVRWSDIGPDDDVIIEGYVGADGRAVQTGVLVIWADGSEQRLSQSPARDEDTRTPQVPETPGP